MKHEDRKATIAAYRERPVQAGIYALRCTASGECWVGRAPDLATIENRLRFTLRMGGSPHRALQAAWRAHGGESFAFEALERFDDEELGLGRDRILKARHAHWCATLGARSI